MDQISLPRKFYHRRTEVVARDLIGAVLCVRDGKKIRRFRIVETEAYLGLADEACHSFKGVPTPRTKVMYGEPGIAYVYLIYGIYFCFNVITREAGCPEAVLIRAVEPIPPLANPLKRELMTNGPGKLSRELGITLKDNGVDLCSEEAGMKSRLWIEARSEKIPSSRILSSKRIGIESRLSARDLLLRFYLAGSPYVSGRVRGEPRI